MIYDKLSSLVLEIQPVKYVSHQYEAAGETATIKMSSSAFERDYKDFSSPSSIFSVSEDVVAVRLKIYYSESPELSTLTIIAPIENASRLTKVKIVGDSAGVAKSKFVIMKTSVEASGDNLSNSYTCNCPLVELENTTCGYKCKYCANYIDNVIDGVNCNISCGTTCTNPDCPHTDCGGDSLF